MLTPNNKKRKGCSLDFKWISLPSPMADKNWVSWLSSAVKPPCVHLWKMMNNVLTDLNFLCTTNLPNISTFLLLYIITLSLKIAFDAGMIVSIRVCLLAMSKTLPEMHHQFFGSTFFVDLKKKSNFFLAPRWNMFTIMCCFNVTEELPWQSDMFHFSF